MAYLQQAFRLALAALRAAYIGFVSSNLTTF